MTDKKNDTHYTPFDRKIEEYQHPTIDAASDAFNKKRSNNQAEVDAEITQKQAKFKEQIENKNRENDETKRMATTFQNSKSDTFYKQEKFHQENVSAPKSRKQDNGNNNGLSTTWFFISLIISLIFDSLGALINLFPVVGGIISSIIFMPAGLGALWYIHKINGVIFTKKVQSRFVFTLIIESIPVLNILPALTMLVFLNKMSPMIENTINNSNIPYKSILDK